MDDYKSLKIYSHCESLKGPLVCTTAKYRAELKLYLTKTRSTQRAQTSADPEDPDFGLWTPGSEA